LEFSYSGDIFIFKSKIKEINTRYIYYTLLSLWDNIIDKMHGSVIKHLTKEKFNNFAIYIPNDISKIPLITDSISEEYDKIEELKKLIFELENQIKDLIINYEGETKEYKLSELCIFLNKSKRLAGFGKKVGEYNFYTSSNNIKKCSIADYNTEAILIGTGGNSCCHYINGLFSCSGDIILLKSINEDIDTVLCYNTIKINFNNLCNKMYGSTIKHLNKEILLNFSINIPIEIEKYSYNIKEFFNKKLELENELIQRKKQFETKIAELKYNAINN
jgi:type I restriction enzyme S subunit